VSVVVDAGVGGVVDRAARAAAEGAVPLVPAAYDLIWGLAALLVPVGALGMLYLVVRLAARHGSASAPGLTYLAVHAVGERTWPRAHGSVRRASLTPRPVRGVTPGWLRGLTTAWTVALGLTLVGCAVVAQDGVRLVATVDVSVRTTSPFPGAFYGVPLAVGVGLVLLGTVLLLRQVARRPTSVDDDPAYDDAARLLTGHRVLRGTQLVVGWTLAGVLVVAGLALRDVELDGPGVAVLVVAVVVALCALAVTLVPGRAAVPTSPRSPAAALAGGPSRPSAQEPS
jgi:hypothetical protein